MLSHSVKATFSQTKKILRDFSFLERGDQVIDYLVLLNRPLHRELFYVLDRCRKKMGVADGAANRLYQLDKSLKPTFIVGDLDSIKPEVRNYYQEMGVTVEQDNNQDNTDYEKTVEKIARDEQKGTLVAVLGAFGGRMDQTLQVISSTLRMCRQFQHLDLFLVDESSMMYCLQPTINYKFIKSNLQEKKGCGLVSFSKATNVRTKGLRWNFDEQSQLSEVEFGRLISTSNEMLGDLVQVSSDGELFWMTTMNWHRTQEL